MLVNLRKVLAVVPHEKDNLTADLRDSNDAIDFATLKLVKKCVDTLYTSLPTDGGIINVNGSYTCIESAKLLLDFTWEQLNTGSWKDVAIQWRFIYTVASFVKCIAEMIILLPYLEIYGCEKCLNESRDICIKHRAAIPGFDNVLFNTEATKCNWTLNMSKECTTKDYLSRYVTVKFQALMRTIDMGLIMGAPLLQNILARTATAFQDIYNSCIHKVEARSPIQEETDVFQDGCIHKKIPTDISIVYAQRKNPHVRQYGDISVDPFRLVKKLSCPSVDTFRIQFMCKSVPSILTNCVDYWPAFGKRRWSLEYIKEIVGCRTVPIEIGSKYTDDDWSQKLMTVGEFIDGFISQHGNNALGTHCPNPVPTLKNMGYLAQYDLFQQVPELRDDIDIPTYCCLGDTDDIDINAWFGPKGTVSPLHHDPKHNFLVQVCGFKYVRLYSPSETRNLYPYSHAMMHNTSEVDILSPDLIQFPKFHDAHFIECILSPGDMLYIPPGYWHYVESLTVSFSVSFWWQ